MKIGILNYDQGNIKSLKNAINHIGYECDLVSSPSRIMDYNVLFLPGVGAFDNAMNCLESNGLIDPINEFVSNGKKLIGICLGMQLLFDRSLEFGDFKGLGLIKGEVLPLIEKTHLKVPHVGWNNINSTRNDQHLEGDYYFVHSYYCNPKNAKDILFTIFYGNEFCCAVKKDNIIGFQFHPEKSQKKGLELLKWILNE